MGQITFVIAALILLSLKFANQRRDLASGAALGVGLVLKPVCAPLLLYYLLKRKWTVAAGAGLVVAVAVVVGLLTLGADMHVDYLNHFGEFAARPKIAVAYQNIPAFWTRLLAWEGHSPTTVYAHLVEALSMAGQVLLLVPPLVLLLLRPWRRLSEGDRLAEFSLLLLATVLSADASGLHTMVYALPGLVVAVVWLRRRAAVDASGVVWWVVAWAVAWCLLALEFQYRAPGLTHGLRVVFISSKLVGGLILWALLLRMCAPTRAEVSESCE